MSPRQKNQHQHQQKKYPVILKYKLSNFKLFNRFQNCEEEKLYFAVCLRAPLLVSLRYYFVCKLRGLLLLKVFYLCWFYSNIQKEIPQRGEPQGWRLTRL